MIDWLIDWLIDYSFVHSILRAALLTWLVFCVSQVWFSDLKEETESTYSIHTMRETTPLSKTGPFVYEGPYESEHVDNNSSQMFNGQTPADAVATLDVSAPEAQY